MSELDEPNDRFGTTFAGIVGIELPRDRRLSSPPSPPQLGDLRDWICRRGLDGADRQSAVLTACVPVEHAPHVLSVLVGGLNLTSHALTCASVAGGMSAGVSVVSGWGVHVRLGAGCGYRRGGVPCVLDL